MTTTTGTDMLISLMPFAIWLAVLTIPSVRLLRRTGIHAGLAALNLFPFFGTVILIWIIAYAKWPKVQNSLPAVFT